MTILTLMVFRSPITGDIKGEVYEGRSTAEMMAIAYANTFGCTVKLKDIEVDFI